MTRFEKHARKSYALRRMTLAIERAIERPSSREKERAARWAAAWGLLCGIRTEGVNLRPCEVHSLETRLERRSGPIGAPGAFSLGSPGSAADLQFSSTISPASASAVQMGADHSASAPPPSNPI